MRVLTLCASLFLWLSGCAPAERSFVLSTTTSVDNSGLLRHLLSLFEKETGIRVDPIVVGSGRALQLASDGQSQAALTHDPDREAELVAAGKSHLYRQFMWNEFVIIGPSADPANVRNARDAADAFGRIHRSRSTFCSRGDRSGTHVRELQIWKGMGVAPESNPNYFSMGQPQAALLRSAKDLDGYVLSDSATFSQFAPTLGLELLFRGDPRLRNVYGVMLVRRDSPDQRDRYARTFVEWLLSNRGRAAIESFRIGGKQQFFVVGK